MTDGIPCPSCGSRRTEWVQRELAYRIRCVDCGQESAPPRRAEIARTVADIMRSIEGKPWHDHRGGE